MHQLGERVGIGKLEDPSMVEQEVSLSAAVTPEMEVPAAPPVHLEPAQFAENEGLSQCACHRRLPKVGEPMLFKGDDFSRTDVARVEY